MWDRIKLRRRRSGNPSSKPAMRRPLGHENLEPRVLMAANPIHVGVVYLETDYLETDADLGSDSRPDRFILSFTGGADDTELREVRIRTDKDGDGLSVGDPMFDTADGGRGKNGYHGFKIHSVDAAGPVTAEATVADGGQELVIKLQGFHAGDRLEFTLDVDEILRNLPDLDRFNEKLDTITSGQEFEDSILEARFEAPHYESAATDSVFLNEFGDPASDFGLQLPPDEGSNVDSRPNRSAAAVGSVTQVPKPISLQGHVWIDNDLDLDRETHEQAVAGVEIALFALDPATSQFVDTGHRTTTDTDGVYKFGTELGLMPGTYRVQETQPLGLFSVGAVAGNVSGSVQGQVDGTDILTGIHFAKGDTHGVDYDFAEAQPATVSGYVFRDDSDDGVRDAGEAGLSGVRVQVVPVSTIASQSARTVITDANGHYQVDGLSPGEYRIVELDQPAPYTDGLDTAGTVGGLIIGAAVNPGDEINGVSLQGSQQGIEYNFGELPLGSLQGFVFLIPAGEDCDGSFDADDQPLPGVRVVLRDAAGNMIAETTTDPGGAYRFDQLPKGVYTLEEFTPDGLLDGHADAGTIRSVTVGSSIGGGLIERIRLPAGGDGVDYNFCEAAPASVGGYVYHDASQDGYRDSGEEPISNVAIDLVDPAGNVVAQTRTDEQGHYRFTNVLPGTYTIRETQPAGYYDGLDRPGTIAGTTIGVADNPGDQLRDIVLRQGQGGIEYNFGELRPASLSGRVHVDADGDCEYDPGELLLSGVVVRLMDASGQEVDRTETDVDGRYRFTGLRPGTYAVVEEQPAGYFDGGVSAGSAGGDASQPNRISQITLASGEVAVEYDFCEKPPAEISGYVFSDRDGDCLFDPAELPIEGVLVELLGDDGNVLEQTRTDSLGQYRFTHLAAGRYTVRETQPSGYLHGGQRIGNGNGDDSQADLLTNIDIRYGARLVDYNFCELEPASLSGQVIIDSDGDCRYDVGEVTLSGVRIELLDSNGNVLATTTTDGTGRYRFENLAPGEYQVRETQPTGYFHGGQRAGSAGGDDSQADLLTAIPVTAGADLIEYNFCELEPASISGHVFIDQDHDCRYDAGEQPLSGVTVELLDPDGNVLATTNTDANGLYRFDDLAPGEYQVRELQPTGYYHGGQRAGSAGGDDSEADLLSAIPIMAGADLIEYDFCELEPASLSGHVFIDQDHDCRYDSGEQPLSGVTVELLDADGNILATTTTDASGAYRFDDLAPGEYQIRELQPTGYFHGGQRAGSGGGDDSQADLISAIPITAGADLIEYDFCELTGGSLSGRVWSETDFNQTFDSGETPLPGVTVELIGADGRVIDSVETSQDGRYRFDDLAPGVYAVRELQPNGYFHGGQVAGSAGGERVADDWLGAITIRGGMDAVEYNFPETPPATISGYVFQDGPALSASEVPRAEQLREYRDGQRTADDAPLAGVVLELRTITGAAYTADLALAGVYADGPIRVVTNADGYYEFTGLRRGSYHVYQVQPDDYLDGLDTVGTTGGKAVNPADIPEDVGLQFLVQTLAASEETDPRNDAILNVSLAAGGRSDENNFSEIIVQPLPPPLPPIDNPQPETPGVPIETFPTSFNWLAPTQTNSWLPATIYEMEYRATWHLSVINGGQPRGEGLSSEDGSVIHKVSAADAGTAWQTPQHQHGVWTLVSREGERLELSDALRLGDEDAVPLAGDFNGDGRDEMAIFVAGQWFIDLNGNGVWDAGDLWVQLGTEMDRPVVGDWDGDGKDDVGIFGPEWHRDPLAIIHDPGLPDPANWRRSRPKNTPPQQGEAADGERRLQRGEAGRLRADLIDHVFRYGEQPDVPLAGDWNGDGIDAIAVFQSGRWMLDSDGDGRWTERDQPIDYGTAGDEPLVGDWNGDGIDDLGVARGDQWILDSDGDGKLTSDDERIAIPTDGDPAAGAERRYVSGDWDGDGRDEPAAYRTRPGSQDAPAGDEPDEERRPAA